MVNEQRKYLDKDSMTEYSLTDYDYEFIADDPGKEVEWATVDGTEGQKTKLRFEDNLNVEKQQFIKNEFNEYLMEIRQVYKYNQDLKVVEMEELYCSGNLVLQKEYKYDDWGNTIYEYYSDSKLKKYFHYLNNSSSLDAFPAKFIKPEDAEFNQVGINKDYRNLLVDSFQLNYSPIEVDPIPIQSHYVYSSTGNVKIEAKNWYETESKWIKKKYRYDNYGNVIEVRDSLNNLTTMEYDDTYSSPYLTKITQKGENGASILDAKGNSIPGNYIIRQMGYDRSTGLKTWEIDAQGHLTEYEYDLLGRLTKIIYPDDDDIFSGVIGNLGQAFYTGRDNNPVKIQYYDDEQNQTIVVNVTENID